MLAAQAETQTDFGRRAGLGQVVHLNELAAFVSTGGAAHERPVVGDGAVVRQRQAGLHFGHQRQAVTSNAALRLDIRVRRGQCRRVGVATAVQHVLEVVAAAAELRVREGEGVLRGEARTEYCLNVSFEALDLCAALVHGNGGDRGAARSGRQSLRHLHVLGLRGVHGEVGAQAIVQPRALHAELEVVGRFHRVGTLADGHTGRAVDATGLGALRSHGVHHEAITHLPVHRQARRGLVVADLDGVERQTIDDVRIGAGGTGELDALLFFLGVAHFEARGQRRRDVHREQGEHGFVHDTGDVAVGVVDAVVRLREGQVLLAVIVVVVVEAHGATNFAVSRRGELELLRPFRGVVAVGVGKQRFAGGATE